MVTFNIAYNNFRLYLRSYFTLCMAAKKFSKQEVLCILEDSDCSDFDSNISCDESGGNELMS